MIFPLRSRSFRAFTLLSLLASSAAAQGPEAIQVLTPFDAETTPYTSSFGHHLASDGDTLAVAGNQGIYVYEDSGPVGFLLKARLQLTGGLFIGGVSTNPNVPNLSDAPVVLDGNRLVATNVVGGLVHVFERVGQNWNLVRLIDRPAAGKGFGGALALEGSELVIGSTSSVILNDPNPAPGEAWVIDLAVPNSALVPLTPSLSAVSDWYGDQVEIAGGTIVVSAPRLPRGGLALGSVFVFEKDAQGVWVETQVLSSGSMLQVSFGKEIKLSGGRLALRTGLTQGFDGPLALDIYVRVNSEFVLSETISPLNFGPLSSRLLSTAYDYDRAAFVVTAQGGGPTVMEMRSYSGEWFDGVAVSSSGTTPTNFDTPLEFVGRNIVLGRPFEAIGGSASGFVEVYRTAPRNIVRFCDSSRSCQDCPCSPVSPFGLRGGCTNGSMEKGRIETRGEAHLSFDTLGVGASDLNPGSFALLLAGSNQLPMNTASCGGFGPVGSFGVPFADSNGLRCIGGNLQRLGVRTVDANGALGETNAGWGSLESSVVSLGAALSVAPGQTRHLQVFYRDTGLATCTGSINTTDAVTVTYLP